MPVTTPLALLGLLFVPAVVAMYLLRSRRTEAVVPSTLLWQRLATDTEANAPWQRLRRSVLFLLQVLLAIALALLAARPFLERPAGLARDLIVIVDTSASMSATDVQPNRLTAAKQAAKDALNDLPAGGHVSVIEAGRTARVLVTGTADVGRVRQAIDGIQPSVSRGDLTDALALAQQLAVQAGDAQVLVATDAALAVKPTTTVDAPVRVLRVGDPGGSRNQAIVALAIRAAPSAVTRSVFVSVANFDLAAATRRLEVWGDNRLLETRTVAIDAQQKADVVVDDIPNDVGVIEVRLVAGADSVGDAQPDLLAADDRAWAVVPPQRPRNILVVGRGDPYLETALSSLPNSRLFGLTPDEYPAGAVRTDGSTWDLIIFDANLPTTLPATPVLAIAPPASSALGDVTGVLSDPGIGTLATDEPILRYVDLTTTHIAKAEQLVLPAWARSVVPGPKGAPLLYAGVRAGVPTAVLAFEPRESDLPLQVAFPILVANLTGELLGGSTTPATAVKPGDPVVLSVPAGSNGLHVVAPDGRATDLLPGAGGTTVTDTATDELGIYTATPIAKPGPSGTGPGGGAASVPTSAGASPSGASDSTNAGPIRFAVDLFDVDESAIAPGDPTVLERLGAQSAPAGPSAAGGASAGPTASGAPAGAGASEAPATGDQTPTERPTAHDEIWIPIVFGVLVVLCAEWTLFHRDTVVRGWRAMRSRMPRRAAEHR